MAILKIARLGHPVLLRRAEPVENPTAPEMRRLVTDMAETMIDANGLGLAAPQVHVPLRVFVMRDGNRVFALFNPEITPLLDAAATQDTVTQLRAAIRKLLSVADRDDIELAAAVRGGADPRRRLRHGRQAAVRLG